MYVWYPCWIMDAWYMHVIIWLWDIIGMEDFLDWQWFLALPFHFLDSLGVVGFFHLIVFWLVLIIPYGCGLEKISGSPRTTWVELLVPGSMLDKCSRAPKGCGLSYWFLESWTTWVEIDLVGVSDVQLWGGITGWGGLASRIHSLACLGLFHEIPHSC